MVMSMICHFCPKAGNLRRGTRVFFVSIALFFFGVGAGGQTVSFAVINENNPHDLVGSASGFNNFAVLIGGALFQPFVGLYLHYFGHAVIKQGVPIYSVSSYNQALTILPVCFIFSLLLVLFVIRESHPQRKT